MKEGGRETITTTQTYNWMVRSCISSLQIGYIDFRKAVALQHLLVRYWGVVVIALEFVGHVKHCDPYCWLWKDSDPLACSHLNSLWQRQEVNLLFCISINFCLTLSPLPIFLAKEGESGLQSMSKVGDV